MAKAVVISAADLKPTPPRDHYAARQRGTRPSDDLVPLQFKMTSKFVKAFKHEALNRDLKLNELLYAMFEAFMKR